MAELLLSYYRQVRYRHLCYPSWMTWGGLRDFCPLTDRVGGRTGYLVRTGGNNR